MRKVYYWSPFVGNIATIKAVMNSALSLVKYSKNTFLPVIINSCGEWSKYNENLNKKNIKLKNLNNSFKLDTNISGFIGSRIAYLKIFFSSFFLLKRLLLDDKPHFLVAHLITSLPIILFTFFKFETKLIIRVSGKIKMNFLRKLIWRLNRKSFYLITCPTKETQKELIDLGIIEKEKIVFLPDPIIDIRAIQTFKKEEISLSRDKKFFLCIGRFTKQKNHILAIKSFVNISKKYNDVNLVIIGNGELDKKYKNLIRKLNLTERILILDYDKNIFKYLEKSTALLSTSLWEDPGFAMVEAAALNTFIISSNCRSGPSEFLEKNAGLLFESDNSIDLEKKINEFMNMSPQKIHEFKVNAKKNSQKFTKFRHYKILSNFMC